MKRMDEVPASPAIRVVIAAPFPEIVGLHERTAEYADQLDVCGAVTDAPSVVDQARVLQPDVLLLSDRLGVEAADVAARLAAVAPTTRIVLVRSSTDHPAPAGPIDAVLEIGASAETVHGTIMQVAGRILPPVAPPAHGRDDRPADPGGWAANRFPGSPPAALRDEEPEVEGDRSGTGSPDPGEPRGRAWPPPWFRMAPTRAAGTAPTPINAPLAAEITPVREVEHPVAAIPEPIDEGGGTPVDSSETRGWQARESPASASWTSPVIDQSPSGGEPAGTTRPATGPDDVPEPPVWQELSADGTAGSTSDAGAGASPPAVEAIVQPVADAAVPAPATDPVAETGTEVIPEQPRRRTRRPGRARAETVLVFSGKGGVGKSVLATNLAVALSKRGAAVAIVDLDLQYGDVGVLLHLEGHPTSVESLAQQGEQIEREFLDEVMATGPEDVRALLAPSSPEFADLVTAASLRAILRELGRGYDYIIIDSASHLEELVLEVMEVADQILVVTTFNITAVKDTKVTLKLLHSLGIERERIAVVLNQTRARISFPRSDIEKSLRFEMLAHLPFEARVDDTIDTGKPMVLTEPKSDFAKQVNVIVDYLATEEAMTGAPGDRQKGGRRRFGFSR